MGETFYPILWCFSKDQSNFICSTATQTIQFLNDLYNKFDKAIDNYDVYKVKWNICIISDHGMDKGNFLWKVEIVGDGYLVASGLPYPNGKQVPRIKTRIAKEFSVCSSWSSIIRFTWTFQHAKEISNMAIRLMQEVSGFKVWYFKTRFPIFLSLSLCSILKSFQRCLMSETTKCRCEWESTQVGGIFLSSHNIYQRPWSVDETRGERKKSDVGPTLQEHLKGACQIQI